MVQYCEDSLEPADLVVATEEGYIKTEKGFDLDPLNGELLGFSEKHSGDTLLDFFADSSAPRAKTESTKKPPLFRFRIFQQLVGEKPPGSLFTLATALKEESSVVGGHLRNLNEKGIITYSSLPPGTPYVEFTHAKDRPETEPSPYNQFTALTKKIYDVVTGMKGPMRIDDVYGKFIAEREPQDRKVGDPTYMKKRIGKILNHLVAEGYLARTESRQDRQSEISLTPQQREVLSELVGIVEKFQQGDPKFLEDGRRKAEAIVSNPERVAALLHKVQERTKRVDPEETRAQIKTILSGASESGLSSTQIHQALQEGGSRLSKKSVDRFMREMGAPIVGKKGRTNFYGPVQEESPVEPDEQS